MSGDMIAAYFAGIGSVVLSLLLRKSLGL